MLQTDRGNPLYLVTHAKLSPGQQTAQVAHAVADFALHRGDHFANWYKTSQYIISLQAPSSELLETLLTEASHDGYETISFREPDLDHELTAIAFVPSEQVKAYLRKLPLAGKHFTSK